MTPTDPDDHQLGALLRETFERHEHLAQEGHPGAAHPGPRRWPALLATAAVAAVAVSSVALATGGRGGTESSVAAPTTTITGSDPTAPAPPTESVAPHTPGFAPGPTTGQNKDAARARIARSLDAAAEYLGGLDQPAHLVDASAVPAFDPPTFETGGGSHYLTRALTFVSDAADPGAVAQAIDADPPTAFLSEGVGGHRNADGSWSQDLDLSPAPSSDPHELASIWVSVTASGDAVGIRVEAGSTFRAQRTITTAVALEEDTEAVVRRNDVGGPVTDPDELAELVTRFNALPTWPELFHSCPYDAAPEISLQVTSSLGRLRATYVPCYRAWEVRGDGLQLVWLEDSGDHPLADLVEQLARRAR